MELLSNYNRVVGYYANLQSFLYTSNKWKIKLKIIIYISTHKNEILEYKSNKIRTRST